MRFACVAFCLELHVADELCGGGSSPSGVRFGCDDRFCETVSLPLGGAGLRRELVTPGCFCCGGEGVPPVGGGDEFGFTAGVCLFWLQMLAGASEVVDDVTCGGHHGFWRAPVRVEVGGAGG
jgi:hypothetical protein